MNIKVVLAGMVIFCSCASSENKTATVEVADSSKVEIIQEVAVTDTTPHDTDDPAIWINKEDPSKSLVVGTDKDQDGGLYVFDLEGNMLPEKCVKNIQRPNNVDIAYGLQLGDTTVDIAVTTERLTHSLRVFTLPDMKEISNGGLPVFEGETGEEFRDLMGVALYTNPESGAISVIVGRKNGPTDGTYLWQYALESDAEGQLTTVLKRKFGLYSGTKEIEAIAVDNELGYVYYSDEQVVVRKYYAHPDSSGVELAAFAREGFTKDNEGISIYKLNETEGYILVSDQEAHSFRIYPREGTADNPHNHPFLKSVKVTAEQSDGSEITSETLTSDYKGGFFVAMSEGKVFKYYRWTDIAGNDLKVKE